MPPYSLVQTIESVTSRLVAAGGHTEGNGDRLSMRGTVCRSPAPSAATIRYYCSQGRIPPSLSFFLGSGLPNAKIEVEKLPTSSFIAVSVVPNFPLRPQPHREEHPLVRDPQSPPVLPHSTPSPGDPPWLGLSRPCG